MSCLQLELVAPWVGSEDQLQRAASLIAIAVMAEGCSEHIRNNGWAWPLMSFSQKWVGVILLTRVRCCLSLLFQAASPSAGGGLQGYGSCHVPLSYTTTDGCHYVIITSLSAIGIDDKERLVRNAALFAVGQFSEHLQVSSSKM